MGFSLTPSRPFSYVLKRHRDQANPPTWRLRSLSSRHVLELQSSHGDRFGKAMFATVQIGLVGWEGVELDGRPADFRTAGRRSVDGIDVDGGAPADLVELIPPDVVIELGNAILEANSLDPESAKN